MFLLNSFDRAVRRAAIRKRELYGITLALARGAIQHLRTLPRHTDPVSESDTRHTGTCEGRNHTAP